MHGGEPYESYADFLADLKKSTPEREDFNKGSNNHNRMWRDDVELKLAKTHDVFQPRMPNKDFADYAAWKTWFEKLLDFVHIGPIFVGHSLGGVFLAKYFSENSDKKKTKAIFLVAAPFGDNADRYSLATFSLPKDLSRLAKFGSKIHLYASKDDKVVPFADLAKYRRALPEAKVRIFEDRGHFKLEAFPEILRDIKAVK